MAESLEKNRVFDTGELNALRTAGDALLEAAVAASETYDAAAGEIEGLLGEIPGEYRVSFLADCTQALRESIQIPAYEEMKSRLDALLDQLLVEIPGADAGHAEEMAEATAALSRVGEMLMELQGLIQNGGWTATYDEFSRRLEVLKSQCEQAQIRVDELRQKAEAELKGMEREWVPYSVDPVNLSTGNFVYRKPDLVIEGRMPIRFTRYYNALDRHRGVLGRNWVHAYETCLSIKEGEVILQEADGREVQLYRDGEEYRSRDGRSVVRRTGTGEGIRYQYEKEGYLYGYDAEGRYILGEDRNGNRTRLRYEDGRLAGIATDSGSSVQLSYTEEGLLGCIRDHAGRKVSYRYEHNRLMEVTDAEGHSLQYTYGASGRIEQVINGRGIMAVRNSYDDRQRITKQEFPDGGVMTFRYLDQAGQVILREQNGNEITYEHDSQGRNTRTVYTDGEEQNAYDKHNRQIWHKNKRGYETWYAYEEDGRLSGTVNALGEETRLSYDACGRLTGEERADGSVTKYSYDDAGNLTATVNGEGESIRVVYREDGRPAGTVLQDGSRWEYAYDGNGNLTGISSGTGMVFTYAYDALNRVVRSVDGCGNATEYAYDNENRITRITNAEGNSRTIRYNGAGAVEEVTDYDGHTMAWTYDRINKPASFRDKEGRITRMSYDTMWNMTEKVLPDGGTITYTYDLLQRLVEETDQTGAVTRYGYDACGNRISVTTPEGVTTHTEYDALDRPVAWTDGKGRTERAAYDACGRIIRRENRAGGIRTYRYDRAGRLLCETDEAGGQTRYRYNGLGQPESMTDAAGRETRYSYLPGGLLHRVEYPEGDSREYAYDGCGNVISVKEGNGHESSISYDCMNRPARIRDNQGRDTRYAYDACGNVIRKQEADGSTIRYRYTPEGTPEGVDDSEGMRARYAYDKAGRLCAVLKLAKDGEEPDPGNVMQFNDTLRECHGLFFFRNARGDIETVRDGEGHARHMQYDKDGHMISVEDEDGCLTAYAYDRNGRLSAVRFGDGRQAGMEYDPLGRLVRIQDWLGSLTIERDSMGRPEQVTDHKGRTLSYRRGAAGECLGMDRPDGLQVQYAYDDALRLTGITAWERTADGSPEELLSVRYAYSPTGERTVKAWGNAGDGEASRESIRQYDHTGRLCCLIHKNRDEVLERYEYAYDVRGNKKEIRRYRKDIPGDSGVFTYEYDTLRRLTGVSRDGSLLRTYRFDDRGNRAVLLDYSAGTETRYRYSASDRLSGTECRHEDGSLTTTTYGYDGRGNLVLEREEEAGREHRYAYDAMNRLEKYTDPEYNETMYSHNVLGYRVGIQDPTGGTDYLLDFTRPYHNLLGAGGESFLWDGEGMHVISRNGGSTGVNSVRYALTDELGSPVRYCDAEGHTVGYSVYREYGVEEARSGLLSPAGYTGYQREERPGHYHAVSRSYDALLGRFRSRDVEESLQPLDTLTLNRYLYCGGNPLSYVDVTGYGFTDYMEWGKDILLRQYGLDGSIDLKTQLLLWGISSAETSLKELVDYESNPDRPEAVNEIGLYGSGILQGIIEWGGSTLSNGIFNYRKLKAFEKDSLGMTLVIEQEIEAVCPILKAAKKEIGEKGFRTYAEEKWSGVKEWARENWVEADSKSRGQVIGRALPDVVITIYMLKQMKADWDAGKAAKGGSVPESGTGPQGVGNPVAVEGRGNTGRTVPDTLNEQMAMNQVQSNPLEGATKVPLEMTDPRWPASEGWVKMQSVIQNADGIKTTIHYVYNEITGAFDDFKFK